MSEFPIKLDCDVWGVQCPDCDGTGEAETGLTESFASQRTDQRYEKVKCETCNGEGQVEA